MILNEFVAFVDLGKIRTVLDPRSFVIATLAPSRKSDLARLGIKAMLVGTLANFMTACIAGVLF
jgi:CNT family concentrative nucleoside transporter